MWIDSILPYRNILVVTLGILGLLGCTPIQKKSAPSQENPKKSPPTAIDPDATPPFHGTIFLSGEILTSLDPTAYTGLTEAGRGIRTMYDRRVTDWVKENAFLFQATYDDGLRIEVQVNPEFESQEEAKIVAQTYAEVIGRLPTSLRKDVETVWIHKGVNPFGGGNNNLLIHTGQAALYIKDGILEETLIHEAAHTSLDADHAKSAGWQAAQKADPRFISTYARDNRVREDIAESYLPYFAIRYRPNRISESLRETIRKTIPNRIQYFDRLKWKMHPVKKEGE